MQTLHGDYFLQVFSTKETNFQISSLSKFDAQFCIKFQYLMNFSQVNLKF